MVRKREEINRKDKQGLRQGLEREFMATAGRSGSGPFLDDKRQGVFKSHDNQGNLTEIVKYTADMWMRTLPSHDVGHPEHIPPEWSWPPGSYSLCRTEGGLFRDSIGREAVGAKIHRDGVLLSEGVNELGMLDSPWVGIIPPVRSVPEGAYEQGVREGSGPTTTGVENWSRRDLCAGNPRSWRWYYESGPLHRKSVTTKGRRMVLPWSMMKREV